MTRRRLRSSPSLAPVALRSGIRLSTAMGSPSGAGRGRALRQGSSASSSVSRGSPPPRQGREGYRSFRGGWEVLELQPVSFPPPCSALARAPTRRHDQTTRARGARPTPRAGENLISPCTAVPQSCPTPNPARPPSPCWPDPGALFLLPRRRRFASRSEARRGCFPPLERA